MNKPFRLSAKAKGDLVSIAKYTEHKWGKNQRRVYLKQLDDCFKQLDDCFKQLAESPALGVKCDYIRKGYRKFPSGSHVIFYKQSQRSLIDIIRVLHKRSDYHAQLITT